MGIRIIEEIYDDITGETGAQPVTFGFDGNEYVIDLTPENRMEFENYLSTYIQHATDHIDLTAEVPTEPKRRLRGRKVTAASYDSKTMRRWARDNGYEISGYGKIPAAIQEAYLEAQRG